MRVYQASDKDLGVWLKLAKEFYAEGFDDYKWGFNDAHAQTTYLLFIQNHLCFLAEDEGKVIGCMAGVITQHHFNYDFVYYQEAMWYIIPEYRGKGVASQLLEATEGKCRELGCQKLAVGHPQDQRLDIIDKIFKQMGFKPFEKHYIKDL